MTLGILLIHSQDEVIEELRLKLENLTLLVSDFLKATDPFCDIRGTDEELKSRLQLIKDVKMIQDLNKDNAFLKDVERISNYSSDVYAPGEEFQVKLTKDFLLLQQKHDDHLSKISNSLTLIESFGGIDGEHHKTWVIDQVVRSLTGENYKNWVKAVKDGEDGPDTYAWKTGIAP